MKFIKPNYSFPDIMSKEITILKTRWFKIEIQEIYDPHFIHINIWRKNGKKDIMFVLTNWMHIPINRHARLVHKASKYENKYNKAMNDLRRYNNE